MSIILNASIVILSHHYYYYCTSRFPSMINILLNLVIVKGIHVSSRTEVKSKWCELNEDIYLNGCFAPFKSIYYKKGEYRNLRNTNKSIN